MCGIIETLGKTDVQDRIVDGFIAASIHEFFEMKDFSQGEV